MSQAIQKKIIEMLSLSAEFKKVVSALGVPDLKTLTIVGESQAWVIELIGNPDPNQRDIGEPYQKETQHYAVLIGIKATNDPTGARSEEALEAKRLAVRSALFALVPAPGHDAFTLAGAELLYFSTNAVFWVERFKTAHIISKESLL